MSSASQPAPSHHSRHASGDHPGMFDALRKRTKRQQQQREQRIDALVQEQRERQLRSFRRISR